MESGRFIEQENIQLVTKSEFLLEIDKEIPIMHEVTKEDIENLKSEIVGRIMEKLKPIIQRFTEVSDVKVSNTLMKDSETTDVVYHTRKDKNDLTYEIELLKVKLEEKEKENKLLRNEVLDMNKLLEAKIQTSSYNFKTPTKEDLFVSNKSISSTPFAMSNCKTPNGDITKNRNNKSDNDTISSVQEISFVPLIASNIDTPIAKEKLTQHSSDKNVKEKTTFKSTTLVATTGKEINKSIVENTKFKSTKLITSKKDQTVKTTLEKDDENSLMKYKQKDVEIIEEKEKEQTIEQQNKDNEKSNKEGKDLNPTENKKHPWPKGTCVIIGDSMLEGVDERKMSSKRLIKVRKFPGATIDDMRHYLIPILEKKPDHIILHVGTNDTINHEGNEIIDKLLQLKSFILEKLPETNIVISKLILRTDAEKPKAVVTDVNIKLNELNVNMIDNKNLTERHLRSKGLHLNGKGILLFAKNLIEGIRKL